MPARVAVLTETALRSLFLTRLKTTTAAVLTIGLVSAAVPRDDVLPYAQQLARTIADRSQHATRWTKRSINGWLRLAMPIF